MDSIESPHTIDKTLHNSKRHGTDFVHRAKFTGSMEYIKDMEIRDSDIIISSFPKSGTTWTQEIVYLLIHKGDFAKAKSVKINERIPYVEHEFHVYGRDGESINAIPDPRILKVHLPYTHCPEQVREGRGKIIYISRNPLDVLVSYYLFSVNINITQYSASMEQFCKEFAEGKVIMGPWHSHVLSFWNNRHKSNILFLKYEDLQSDCKETIKRIAKFLAVTVCDSFVAELADHVSFESMSKNDKTNYDFLIDEGLLKSGFKFMRKGKVGDWKNHLTSDMYERMYSYYTSTVKEHGLEFDFELPTKTT